MVKFSWLDMDLSSIVIQSTKEISKQTNSHAMKGGGCQTYTASSLTIELQRGSFHRTINVTHSHPTTTQQRNEQYIRACQQKCHQEKISPKDWI